MSEPPFPQRVRELEGVVFRVAMRAVRDRELAKDLAQETLVHALANAAQYRERAPLKAWVLGILSHKVLDLLRARHQRLDGGDDDALIDPPSAEDVERTVMARHDLKRVEAALAELPARERLALVLTDVEGLPRSEVCHALDVNATHLRVILHRARHRLRRLL